MDDDAIFGLHVTFVLTALTAAGLAVILIMTRRPQEHWLVACLRWWAVVLLSLIAVGIGSCYGMLLTPRADR